MILLYKIKKQVKPGLERKLALSADPCLIPTTHMVTHSHP